ncbi:Putative flippase GtrA (transmembrane translocase of bactoprenol-linked glucose) [Mucilaginibacter mallensis]|uniref:Putative flippase GtrA (Transmembrane translocase of bactoprenol-linked glucose) n=1 Tax=Mucilaginibacter mallensis TaxID=652787 RepID=A0A1H1UT00_MUCMA|nr:GtrA family protein [Mucilaginibacter mallensis]SDS75672.1 Putative flippase GtrA (transmembrane translocase of bactoprenol-linked glucose) [Mucilaginibacter mallensis]
MANKLLRKISKNEIARFVCSAGAGFLVDISVFYLFYHNLLTQKSYHILNATVRNSSLSLAISFFLGVVVNFLITKFLVFTESKSSSAQQFFRFASVAVIGFFANLMVIKLLIQTFGMYPPVARITAALSLFFASYFVHKLFSFSLSLRHHAVQSNHEQRS